MTANPQTAVTRIPLPSHSAEGVHRLSLIDGRSAFIHTPLEGVNNVTQASVS